MNTLRTSPSFRPARSAFALAVAEAAFSEQYLAAEACTIPMAVTASLATRKSRPAVAQCSSEPTTENSGCRAHTHSREEVLTSV